MSAYLLLILTKNFTIFLYKYTEHSTTKVNLNNILFTFYNINFKLISLYTFSISY